MKANVVGMIFLLNGDLLMVVLPMLHNNEYIYWNGAILESRAGDACF